MIMTPDWEPVSCEYGYRILCFWNERPSIISLIVNSKEEKTQLGTFKNKMMLINVIIAMETPSPENLVMW